MLMLKISNKIILILVVKLLNNYLISYFIKEYNIDIDLRIK